jgi:methionine synthase II (cobalamin-independent)
MSEIDLDLDNAQYQREKLEAELAKARAQTVSLNATLRAELASANRWISELVNDLSEARAQIAAMDVANKGRQALLELQDKELKHLRADEAHFRGLWEETLDRAEKAEAQIAEHKHKNEGVGWWEREGGV